jgi:hypothetical protein
MASSLNHPTQGQVRPMNTRTLTQSLSVFLKLPVFAGIGIFMFAATGQAGIVTASLMGGQSFAPYIYINAGDGSAPSVLVNPGYFSWTTISNTSGVPIGSAFNSYCIDLNTTVASGPNYAFNIQPIGSAGAFPINPSAVPSIEKLWAGFYSQTSILSTVNTPGGTAINDAAFQLAIWRLEYDFGKNGSSYNLNDFSQGQFQAAAVVSGIPSIDADSAATLLLASQLVQFSTDGTYNTLAANLFTLTGGHAPDGSAGQDQLTVATPEPSSMCLCAVGASAILIARHRRRKAAQHALTGACC